MSVNDRAQLKWLMNLSRLVRDELGERLPPNAWQRSRSRESWGVPNNSGGWTSTLGSVRGERGSRLDVWLDHWTQAPGRRLYYGYRSMAADKLRAMARAGTGGMEVARSYENSYARSPDGADYNVLRQPLSKDLFGKVIVELNTRDQSPSYFGVYDPIAPQFGKTPPLKLARRISVFLSQIAETSRALGGRQTSDRPYPEERNRKKIFLHMRRERNRRLAALVKARDGFRCKVCDLLFEARYGEIGRGYAEAHHVVALARLAVGKRIVGDDLITVCANCHRMLHRMRGERNDWQVLRRHVRHAKRTVD